MPPTDATARQAKRAARSAGNTNMHGRKQNCRGQRRLQTDKKQSIVAGLVNDVHATATTAKTDNDDVTLAIRRWSPPLNARRPESKSPTAFGRKVRYLRAILLTDESPGGLRAILPTDESPGGLQAILPGIGKCSSMN